MQQEKMILIENDDLQLPISESEFGKNFNEITRTLLWVTMYFMVDCCKYWIKISKINYLRVYHFRINVRVIKLN